jgi:lantibiotic modifying enzyme
LLARAYILSEDLNISLLVSERDQITQGNIPAFYTNTLSNDLILENGKRIDLFEMNAMDNLKYKIRHSSVENLNEQLELVEKSLSLNALTT